MSAILISLIILSAAPAPQSSTDQIDITLDADAAQCIIDCMKEKKAQKAASARKGKVAGKKKAAPAAAPAPRQSDRDQRVDALEKDVSRLERESAEHDEIRAEIKKVDEKVVKENFDTRVKASTDHVRQQEKLDQLRKDVDANKTGLAKLREELGGMYAAYAKYNPFSAKLGPRLGGVVMITSDGTRFTGINASARLTLNLRNWVGVFAEGGVIGSVSDRPVSTQLRGGVDMYLLSWTNIPGLKDVGVELALSGTWAAIGERLKARSAFVCLEVGPTFRWVIVERWLALSAGINLLAGGEWDQDHPAVAGGLAGAVSVEF
ncbi:hypothetical protein HY633_01950 [Candidatus Uhrbacteria bacterium]|nr:hypothetical protein [Candidatus Uhrbacteria bacterium]